MLQAEQEVQHLLKLSAMVNTAQHVRTSPTITLLGKTYTDLDTVVRNPEKLRHILTTQFQLSITTIAQYLTLHKGDLKSPLDASKALINPLHPNKLVDTIFFSVGGYPSFQFSLRQPMVLTDPTICEDVMKSVFAGLDELSAQGIVSTQDGQKPLLVVISATAGENVWREVPMPWLVAPLYTWLLSSPQQDKLRMEKRVREDEGAHVRSSVITRPAFLTEGLPKGIEHVKMGWQWSSPDNSEREQEPGKMVGWTIGKSDLGAWVAEKILIGNGQGWEDKLVSLCY